MDAYMRDNNVETVLIPMSKP